MNCFSFSCTEEEKGESRGVFEIECSGDSGKTRGGVYGGCKAQKNEDCLCCILIRPGQIVCNIDYDLIFVFLCNT